MKNTFSAKRFGTYFLHDAGRLWANSGLSLLILGLMPVLLWLLTGVFGMLINQTWAMPSLAARTPVATGALLALSLITPARLYGYLTDRRAGSEWLMIPASRLEKFCSMILITAFLVPALFIGLYLGSDALLSLTGEDYGPALAGAMNLNAIGSEIHVAGGGFWMLYLGIAVSQMTFLLGALCFRRQKAAKTILVILGLMLVLSLVGIPMIVHNILQFDTFFERLDDWANGNVEQVTFLINLFLDLWYILLLGGLGTAIWFRMKTLKH